MSRSASKIRDVRSSVQKEMAAFKSRRSVSVDTRSRGSYVPDKKRPSSEERKSGGNKLINRWGGARKSSINLSETKRKDERPLNDKAYQKRKTTELVECLDDLNFTPPISTTKLMSPSKKDFENIFQFLYRFFDPSYEVKRIEEEAPKILKNLGYPFNLNKSAFVYVARTNWPILLGVLLWLMDLNKFAMRVDMKVLFETVGDDEKAQMHKILLPYICQCYHSGIDYDEEQENAVFDGIIRSSMNVNTEELELQNQKKKELLESVELKIDELKQLADNSALLDKHIEKYEDFISKMKCHYQKKKEVCEQLMEDLKQKESELKALQEEVSKRQDAYDAQGFDGKKHLIYFETQKKELADKLEQKRELVKELQHKFWEAEIEFKKKSTKFTDAVKSSGKLYNDIIESLKNILDPLSVIKIPQVQKVCVNFQLEFPVWEANFNKRNVDYNKSCRDALQNIIEKIKSTDEILKRICAGMQQKLNELEMRKSEITMRLRLLSIQENKQEQDLNSMKKSTDDEISLLHTQLEKVRQTVTIFRDEQSKLEKTYREMIEEQIALTEFLEKKEKELKEYLDNQKELFAYFGETEAEAVRLSEEYGNEIAMKLEELRENL